MTDPATPRRTHPSVRDAVRALAALEGEGAVVDVCTELVGGARPETWPRVAVGLSGFDGTVEGLRAAGFRDYWWRTWGARGLLYVWADRAGEAVVRGLDDPHWRPAEMCLKVAAQRQLSEASDSAVRLAGHEPARVRAAALRLLGVAGDTEHVATVRGGLADDDPQVRRAAALAVERMVARLDLPAYLLP
jgi:HEAT repeat protein